MASSTILGQNALTLSSGTTAERPTGVSGNIRYNTTTNALECYTNFNWETISTEKIYNLTTFGSNNFALLKGGKLFTTHGSTGGNNYYLSGRGGDGNDPFYGVDSGLKEVPIPNSSQVDTLFKGHDTGMGVLLTDGSLWMWGLNTNGQCGTGATVAVLYPYNTMNGVAKVWGTIGGNDHSTGKTGTFLQKTDGTIWACGNNVDGNLGIGSTVSQSSWVQVTALGTSAVYNIFNLSSSGACTFVEMNDGRILACGYNAHGALGTGNLVQQNSFIDVTARWGGNLAGGHIIKMCYAGAHSDGTTATYGFSSMMLRRTGVTTQVRTCGNNDFGGIGNNTVVDVSTSHLIPYSTAVNDISMVGGRYKTCHMLNTDGTLHGWGYNGFGQVGYGTTTQVNTPVLVATGIAKLFSNTQSSGLRGHQVQVFIKSNNGRVYTVGYEDATGYLGTGAIASVSIWQEVKFHANANIIEMGSFCTSSHGRIQVALSDKNKLYVWGYNGHNGVCAYNTVSCQIPTGITFASST